MKWSTTSIVTAVIAFLTIIASLPYELGEVANILPPEWKTRVAIGGAVATMVLRLIKTNQIPLSNQPATPATPLTPEQPTTPQS